MLDGHCWPANVFRLYDTEEAIGTNINPTAVVDVVTGLRVVNLNDKFNLMHHNQKI